MTHEFCFNYVRHLSWAQYAYVLVIAREFEIRMIHDSNCTLNCLVERPIVDGVVFDPWAFANQNFGPRPDPFLCSEYAEPMG